MDNLNKVEYIKIEFLSPTHIGIGIEKKWLKDVDFISNLNNIKLIDINRTYNALDEISKTRFLNSLSEGHGIDKKLIDKIQFKGHNKITSHNYELIDIQPLIRTGNGEVYLPGSSIKGAMRSCLFNYFNSRQKHFQNDREVFGDIDNNLMQLLKISDFIFHDTTFINRIKIYNLFNNHGSWAGGWKDLGGTSHKFRNKGFTTDYETFPSNANAWGKFMFSNGIQDRIFDKKKSNIPAHTHSFIDSKDFTANLFSIINEYSEKYIDKEIMFFEKYENDQTESIIKSFRNIKNRINNDKGCIIRVGCGSGFYAMTGDWKYPNHTITVTTPGKPGTQYKSRKISFANNNFVPMGFIAFTIISEEEYIKGIKAQTKKPVLPKDTPITTTTGITVGSAPKEKIKEEPKLYTGAIKSGAGPIYAEIVESGRPNKVKLFIEGLNQVFILSGYSSEIEKGKIIKVKINICNKAGAISQIGFVSQ